jgi:hypothetical protein
MEFSPIIPRHMQGRVLIQTNERIKLLFGIKMQVLEDMSNIIAKNQIHTPT